MDNKDFILKKNNRIMISAPSSGSGKTLITCGLLNLFGEEGSVKAFKCGPDYIDPLFHQQVLGITSQNLDSFFMDDEALVNTCIGSDADITVIEGVMGLFDGLGSVSSKGSAYDIAHITGTPIILVMDAKGIGQTLVELINGLVMADSYHLIKGVILNRTTKNFYETIAPLIKERTGIEPLGFIPVMKQAYVPSRHLGLVLPGEIENIKSIISSVSEQIKNTVNIEAIKKISECTFINDSDYKEKTLSENIKDECKLSGNPVIAVAKDEAFCFIYEDNLKILKENGCDIVFFSPIHDKYIPKEAAAIYLPGGYPENYLDELSSNKSMLDDIYRAFNEDAPIWAECGGFMYLHDKIYDIDNKPFNMVGALNGNCTYAGRLVRFGYIDIEFPDGNTIKGHEFHYYDTESNGDLATAIKPITGKNWKCMFYDPKVGRILGFPHLYLPSCPQIVSMFVNAAAAYSERF